MNQACGCGNSLLPVSASIFLLTFVSVAAAARRRDGTFGAVKEVDLTKQT